MNLEDEIAFLKSQIGVLINAINGKESEMKANAPKMTEYYTHVSTAHETESAKKFDIEFIG